MRLFLAIATIIALGVTAFFLLVRDFPVLLAAVSGGSIGALAFVAMTSLSRLRRQLSTPIMTVERGKDSNGAEG